MEWYGEWSERNEVWSVVLVFHLSFYSCFLGKLAVLISLTKTKTKIVVNENTLESLTKTKIETKILAKTIKKRKRKYSKRE